MDPLTMTTLEYQESKAIRVAGGIPILNARDRREHEKLVVKALDEGKEVAPRTLKSLGRYFCGTHGIDYETL